ncbi:MAG: nucleotide exchange factor GrpE [Saprospiraceae bacterium]|jgi:molecular chaperone GrpE|nr:nucleotide exchange factor GrpE [Saprospiraceae bacterium]
MKNWFSNMSKNKKKVKKQMQDENINAEANVDQQEEDVMVAENDQESVENQENTPEVKLTSEEKLHQEMAEIQQQHAELKDKYMRLLADFDNYKKRTIKEKIDFMRTAAEDTMSALLPVLDDFDRAKKIADDENSTEQFSEGVSLVYNKIHSVLKQRGLEPMETNGEAFDAEFHEALTEIPAPSEDMKGKIIDTIERGYILKDKIIRHAKVVVGK